MGFFSSLGEALGFGGAGKRAAAQQIAEQKKGQRKAERRIQPFFQAGVDQLGALEEGTTPEGLDARLGRIFDTESFGRLLEERTRAVQGGLAAGGLTRSGAAIEELSAVPTDLGFQIEQLLTGRSAGLVDQGFQAAGGLSNIATRGGEFRGTTRAQGTLLDASTRQKTVGSALKFGAKVAGSFF